ncbi:hypothetical protein BKH06_12680 [Actinomyces naeslundii]|uniref:hypothetical protein n=1 Tax=Actinomyces naeslundii TaxID=1655 RepID=UPI00096CE9E8|nr:hypothetical protein [Actinomyces naeslundii]OMG07939.1 hypothetical protein BKH06_12680 [Actinomyces naeslundii]
MANEEPLYRAIIPEGTHLARSNSTEGAFRGAVLDDETNQVSGQAELVEVDRDEDDEPSESSDLNTAITMLAVAGVSIAGTIFVSAVTPKINAWWRDTASPSLKAKLSSLLTQKTQEGQKKIGTTVDSAALAKISSADALTELSTATADPKFVMSSEEAQQRLATLLFAAAVAAHEYRTLKDASIVDKSERQQIQELLDRFADESVVSLANRVFESNSALGAATDTALQRILGQSSQDDGAYLPLQHDQFRELLQLS